ncbi:MAG: alpha-glucan phosphorylase [Nocardioidaceae bacterium]|jgi:starch phosphorylase|nr:alpha-glucan phosphorylase [Nocardioidaceae bacterium]
MRAIRRFTVRPALPAALAPLEELATNLRWSWHLETQDLFAAIDPDLWATAGHDPVRLLGALSIDRLDRLATDQQFLTRLAAAHQDLEDYLQGPRWYQESAAARVAVPRAIAYFSPEFGITAVLPQYSGGLGILAGDHLKAASDMGVPMIAVGLLYRHGYFRQSLSREGWQQETYPVNDPDGLPLTLLREDDGTVPHVTVGLPGGKTLAARVWIAQVGRVPLLLLDSDAALNVGLGVDVTDRLYGGGEEHRLLQEMLLGIGGVRALRLYCRITGAAEPEVFHSNEGHAGFLGLERIREHMVHDGLDFDAALEITRSGTVFTTHTPVPAGIDRFPVELIKQHFGGDNAHHQAPVRRILELGAESYPGGDGGVFNMAVMGLRLAQRVNGVSVLHGAVSRSMFAGLWPGFDPRDVPIASITNGVHAPTWLAREVRELATGDGVDAFDVVDTLPAEVIWSTKRVLRERLVEDVRRRLRASMLQRGHTPAELGWVQGVLDPDVLTIGFARRVPSYKRLTLMLRDPDRLRSLLLHPQRPVQLVIAGKSHPADEGGKRLIQEIVRFADDPAVRHRIVFLPDYDIGMAQSLYPGCDVWLNNPLRPYEACGTSGMKAALNGGLNLSILDGWWDEWFDGSNGWAIPSADGVDDPVRRDDIEAHALYDLVENEVAARFYDRDDSDLPVRWLEMVRHTLKSLGPKVLATRMVRDYVLELYAPAAATARVLRDGHARAGDLADWKRRVRNSWRSVRIEHIEAAGIGDSPEVGSTLYVQMFAAMEGLSADDVQAEVVYGTVRDDDTLERVRAAPLSHAEEYEGGRHRFTGEVKLETTGPFGYTVRVLPAHELMADPAEMGLVAWPEDPVPPGAA